MKILVTGAGGQVGSAFCRLGSLRNLDIIGLKSNQLDISNSSAVEEAVNHIAPDFIINAAAYTAVDRAEKEPEMAERVNAKGPAYLAQAAAVGGIPLIHYSTDYVFDGSNTLPYKESDVVAPLGVYGQTKLAGERAIQDSHSKYIILRTSWVFGLEGHNFPKTMLRLAKERSEIGVVADQFGGPTFADDLAEASLQMVSLYQKEKYLPWGVYHFSGEPSCSWRDFAEYIFQKAEEKGFIDRKPTVKSLTTAEYPTPAKRPSNSRLDMTHFKSKFPEVFSPEWKKGIDSIIELSM